MTTTIRAFGLSSIALAAGPMGFAAPMPEAGSEITNRADVSYFNPALGTREIVASNVVATTVRPVVDFTITADQEYVRSPGEDAMFAFTVSNTGNADVALDIGYETLLEDFDFSRTEVFRDTNGNGRIDAGDGRVKPGTPVTLAFAEDASYLVRVIVPETAREGQIGRGQLSARLAEGEGASALEKSAIGTVIVETRALSLTKSASAGTAAPGGSVTYTLRLRNNSAEVFDPATALAGAPISIDGEMRSVILVSDAIPVNTQFDEIVDAVNFDVVYRDSAATAEEWSSEPPETGDVAAIGFVSDEIFPTGSARDFMFSVTVNETATGTEIENTGHVRLPGPDGAGRDLASNTVRTPVGGAGGEIAFFGDDSFSATATAISLGTDTYVELASGACNTTTGVDEVSVVISTQPGADRETVRAVETGPNTGIFRTGAIPSAQIVPATPENGAIEGRRRTVAAAEALCDPDLSADVSLSPAGAVFSSVTNEPVPGARVELYTAGGGLIATTQSDAEGLFEVAVPGDRSPAATEARYVLQVTPPDGQTAPSVKSAFPGFGRLVDGDGSYGRIFTMPAGGGAINFDIPVDPATSGALVVDKTVDRPRARTGEIVTYTVEVTNRSTLAIEQAEIRDRLPAGFRLIADSSRLDGQAFADPAIETPELSWDLDMIGPGERVELSYSVAIGPNAGQGVRTNIAFAQGSLVGLVQPVMSNTASADVRVDDAGGVFAREGTVLGKVFLDCDDDGRQYGANEVGVPGVVIHTDDGQSVMTDPQGRFSLPGLSARTHVLDVFEPSLPEGAVVTPSRVIDAGNGGSRFVPLKVGEVRSEDFALTCSPDIEARVRARIDDFSQRALGLPDFGGPIRFETPKARLNTRASQAIDAPRQDEAEAIEGPEALIALAELVPHDDLESLLEDEALGLGLAGLEGPEAAVSRRTVTLQARVPDGLNPQLVVNGEIIRAARIGRQLTAGGVSVTEYVALPLAAGANLIELQGTDSFGNVRDSREITLKAPGEPAGLRVIAPESAIADPTSRVPVWIEVTDKDGHPVAAPAEVTLIAPTGQFDLRDTSEARPGLQSLVERGRVRVGYIPSGEVGRQRFKVISRFGEREVEIRFTADTESEAIAVGLLEGAVIFSDSGDRLGTALPDDRLSWFEDTEEGLEGSLYLKGKVAEDTLLTLRYDSDRADEAALFRDERPDEGYAVLGDSSRRGFDARSRGKIFAELQRGSSAIGFGDVSYAPRSSAIELGSYQRTLEGAYARLEGARASLDLYLAETDTGQRVIELPSTGLSGPYDLDAENVVRNSETVELIVRDRDQPGLILSSEPLQRFEDYTLDYFSGSLILTRAIPLRDENLNPISLRVTLETDPGMGEDYTVMGGEAAFDLTDWMRVGARHLESDAPAGSADAISVTAGYIDTRIGESGRLSAEFATADTADGSGEAWRVGYEADSGSGRIGARIASSDEGFKAPGAAVNAGRTEARAYVTERFENGMVVSGEAIYTGEAGSDRERFGAVARVEGALSDRVRGRVGARAVRDLDGEGNRDDALTAIVGVNWIPEAVNGANIDLEIEQDVTDGENRAIRLGADYAATEKLRLYTQAELSSSRSGRFGLSDGVSSDATMRAGAEYRLSETVGLFSEYRAREDLFDSGLASGLTMGWDASPTLNVRLRAEHVQPIAETYDRSTALGVGLTREPEDQAWIADGDVEYAVAANDRQTWYVATTYGRRWDDVTFVARNRFAAIGGGDSRLRNRLRLGWAHRPPGDEVLNTLAWYEYQVDDTPDLRETRQIWSFGGERKIEADWRLRGRFAGQYYSLTHPGGDTDLVTMIWQLGGDVDVSKRVNLAGDVAYLTDGRFENATFGVNAEANFILKENALIGLGYSYTQLDEERVRGLWRKGFYLRLRLKFDQSLWNIFDD